MLWLDEASKFIAEYASTLLGSGAYTSRVVRCSARIAKALGLEVEMITSHANMILTVGDGRAFLTKIVKTPRYPIRFELNADLCRLSWLAVDDGLSLRQIKRLYELALAKPRMDSVFTLFIASFANASFCRLFDGDALAMAIVFSSTLVGFSAKQFLQKRGVNEYLVFIVSSFFASVCSASALCFDCAAETALATSPLFLIPGVPLINGVIDILDGHTIAGCTRLIKGMILVICIAVGLSLTLALVKGGLM